MSDTLYEWLNKEVKLSVKITDITSQFANGYYFGELLHKYDLLPQFNEFKNTMIPLDITRNFSLLQKKLEDLSIHLTEIDKGEILSKKKYKAELFLFKIKQKILSKLLDIEEIMERTKHTSELKTFYKALNMGNYNTVTKKAKERAKTNIPQRKIQSARLPQIKNRFEKIKKISSKRESAEIIDILEEEKFIQNQHMNEKKYIERLESAKHQKNLDTEKKNKENWNNEMIKYKESNENKLKELKKKTEYYQKATDNYFKNSCKDNKIIVDAFDENLSKMGLDMKIIDPKADKLKGKVVSTEIFLKKIREK